MENMEPKRDPNIEEHIKERAQKVFESLNEEIKAGITRLRNEAPDSPITEYVERCLTIMGREKKINALDALLRQLDQNLDLGSLCAIRDAEERQIALENIKDILSEYTSDQQKEQAKQSLDRILNP